MRPNIDIRKVLTGWITENVNHVDFDGRPRASVTSCATLLAFVDFGFLAVMAAPTAYSLVVRYE